MPYPPSGEQHRLEYEDQVGVVTEVGACLRVYEARNRKILDGFEEDEMCPRTAGMPLLPWPNRIDGGRYEFEGQAYGLALDRPEERNAIHGLTRWLAWNVGARTADAIRMEVHLPPSPGYPFDLVLDVGYRLGDQGLEVTLGATNVGSRALPFGAGHHPYFLPRSSVDQAFLKVAAKRSVGFGDRWLPLAERNASEVGADFCAGDRIGGRILAHNLTQLDRDAERRAWVLLDDIEVWLGHGFEWVLVYTADDAAPPRRRRSVAIEPMTCPPNAFVTGRDLLVIQPGGRVEVSWGVRSRPSGA